MPVRSLRPTEVAPRLARGDPDLVLLDCREPEEWLVARIEGSLHIPMAEIPRAVSRLDREREYVVVCHHGGRSATVSAYLARLGFLRVSNLEGGIDAWSLEADPKIPRY